MKKRSKQGGADVLVDFIAKLPWWVGVLSAVISYLVLHQLAKPAVTQALVPGQMGAQVASMMWKSLAAAAQYMIPFICLVGALVSAIKQYQRRTIVTSVSSSSTPLVQINTLAWAEFEILVGEVFRQKGYQVMETGGGGPDGGVDLRLKKGSEVTLVQCKQWKAFNVGVTVVRELYGVMAAEGATGGWVVTSGKFSEDARAFCNGRNIFLMEGPELAGLLTRAKASLQGSATAAASTVSELPACPKCGADMVKRKAAKGSHAGQEFWGCSTFPRCGGIRRMN